MLERLDGADTKVTFLLKSDTAKYIRTASAGQEKSQSKFITDVLDSYSEVGELDLEKLRLVLFEVASGGTHTGRTKQHVDDAIEEILSIFGIQQAGRKHDE
jgi:hypothetical protein